MAAHLCVCTGRPCSKALRRVFTLTQRAGGTGEHFWVPLVVLDQCLPRLNSDEPSFEEVPGQPRYPRQSVCSHQLLPVIEVMTSTGPPPIRRANAEPTINGVVINVHDGRGVAQTASPSSDCRNHTRPNLNLPPVLQDPHLGTRIEPAPESRFIKAKTRLPTPLFTSIRTCRLIRLEKYRDTSALPIKILTESFAVRRPGIRPSPQFLRT